MDVHVLDNGIRAVIIPLGLRSITIEVFLKIGAKYETKEEAGLSHFLEHLSFKGTKKRPKATDILQEMDSIGALYDASTGYEETTYSITTIRPNLRWLVEIMSDLLLNSTLPSSEIVKEQGVIIEEIKLYKDNPTDGLPCELVKFMYGKSPIGCWDIIGSEESINQLNRKALIDYRNRYFNPKEIVIAVAGNVTEADMGLFKNYFDQPVKNKSSILPKVQMILTNNSEQKEHRELEQAHFGLAVPTFGWKDERKYALRLLNVILAGNNSSRLFKEIRSKRGWAYYIRSIGQSLAETGFWGIQTGVKQDKLDKAIKLVTKEILQISSNINRDEMQRAINYLNGVTELLLDSSNLWTDYVGERLLLTGEIVNPEEELKKLNKVKLWEIIDLAKTIFKEEKIKKLIISK